MTIRKPSVAGMFYPSDAVELKNLIDHFLAKAVVRGDYNNIAGIISPHAGYVYSGYSAAFAYNVLKQAEFKTALILSPSHREYFHGMSLYEGDAYRTPLGQLEIDKELQNKILEYGEHFFESFRGHGAEHAVEVQLPFLQIIKSDIKIVPVVIGDQRKSFVDELSNCLSTIISEDTVIIVSSDLSHFHKREIAERLDGIVEKHIMNFAADDLQTDLQNNICEACGGAGIVALLKAAKMKNYSKSEVLSRTDSGDTTGDISSVVGYLSAVVYN
ncbi:MAG: AmmeMemoRadiSam system protein B [Melioribacteraceae bacterium]|nr:AmmeMemoRadiSam system protein B [Melioribacteraceae bacterium]